MSDKKEKQKRTELWEEQYFKLQNGSDIRGVAIAGPDERVTLTPAVVQNIASAFVDYISEKKDIIRENIRIGVGNDSRLSAQSLKQGVISGVIHRGAEVFDCGLASTPAMFMSTVLEEFKLDGAIMITASHLPYNRNGLKFFTENGGLDKEEISEILRRAILLSRMERRVECFSVRQVPLMDVYSAYLKTIIRRETGEKDSPYPLHGLHIVIDASNGVSGYFARLLEEMGVSTEGSIFLEPDGNFPNHVPNPENKEAMNAIRTAVLESGADLGIIFDTDGDRAAVVFSDGEEVNKNTIIALMAAILADSYPHTTVVTDSVTSDHLTEFLEQKLQMHHHRFKRGYKNVINEAIRLNREGVETHLAIETSGHGALKENYFLDDGAYMAVKIICRLALFKRQGRKLQEMTTGLKKSEESREYRIKIIDEDYQSYGIQVLKEFERFVGKLKGFQVVKENYEGVRVRFCNEDVKGWMLLRMSLHDPLMPLNIETEQKGGTEMILKKIWPFFAQFSQLGTI